MNRNSILNSIAIINATTILSVVIGSVIITITNDRLSRKVSKNISMISNAVRGIEPKEYVYNERPGGC